MPAKIVERKSRRYLDRSATGQEEIHSCWQNMGRTIYVIDKQMRGCLAKAGALQVESVNFSVRVPLVRP